MGQVALGCAPAMAIVALVAGRLRLSGNRAATLERWLQRLALVCVGLAVLHVVVLLANQNTSYMIVVDHTRPGLGLVRRVMGLWGGSEGSLLFFTLVIGGVLVAAPVTSSRRAAPSIVLAGLASTSAFAASPFERLDSPAVAGSGLSPILEHWAMIIHPPLLYLGLALALVPALVAPDRRRSFTMAAIAVLTAALTLGGAWAYVELGWGGWYAWDPVENAALIPWLLLVASIHLPVGNAIAIWMTALVWPTVFAGTAMTRTSLRTSVHTFANSEGLGPFLWSLAIIVTIGALAHAVSSSERSRPVGRRIVPVVVVGYAAAVVALGTFRPFIPGDATDGTFYSRYLFPAAIVGLIGLGVVPRRSTPTARLVVESLVGGIIGASLAALVGTTDWWQLTLAAALGIAVLTTVVGGIRPAGRVLAHLGMILILAGTLGGTASTSLTFPLAVGETIDVGGHEVTNLGIDFIEGPPPIITANVTVDGELLQPSLAVYVERGLRLPEVATRRWPHEDLQLIIRNADDDGSVVLTANVEPLTQAVWVGAALVTLAGLLGYSGRFSRRARNNSLTVDAASDAGVVG